MRLLSAVLVLAIMNFACAGMMLVVLHNSLGWCNFIAGFCLVVVFVVLRSES